MFETFTGNRNFRLFCVIFFVLTFGLLQAQEKKTIPDVEKVYLHTDNSIYFIGDDLFYKAYNVSAKNNLLSDNSTILYVELISPDAKIIARNKTNLEIGLGHGDFKLADSLGVKPGVYQLRAYTNWNRNFGEDFVFKKKIEIIDVFEFKSNEKQNRTTEDKTKAPIQSIIDNKQNLKVDFFPEGGSFLENVSSVVGFKAVDNEGKPIEVKGDIYDSDNQLVVSFSSVFDGMRKFQIILMEGKKYYAKIQSLEGIELQQNLPEVQKLGYLLSYRVVKGKKIISILTNEATLLQNPNAVVTVVCDAKGVTYLENTLAISQTTSSFELEKGVAPDGISQITLIDNTNKPQSERLIYIENEKDFTVEISTDKITYQPNEKATVNIFSKSKAGEAKSGSFSLSVTDRNGILDEKNFDSNICTYFLMESDIRGKVHHPAYYFDTTNPKRLDHLDNLLLTQGWRDFVWKTMPKANDTINYIAEKGINISGKVKQLFRDKAKENFTIGLVLLDSKHINTFKTTTDSIGKFKFENLKFSKKRQMTLSSKDEKGKYKGELVLDSIGQPPMLISFKKEPIVWSESTNLVVENVFKKYTAFGVKPENVLEEVLIKSKNKFARPVFYGVADFKYIADKNTKKLATIYDVLDKVPSVVVFDRNVFVNGARIMGVAREDEIIPEKTPLILIDGSPMIDYSQLDWILPTDVEKIEVIQSSNVRDLFILEYESDGSVISIFTNGNGNKPKKETFHSIKQEIEGYYLARTFYSPTPEQAELDNKLAVRNTIYWNPEVRPDKTSNATVNYYNTKVETKVKVALEGITATGIPVVKNVYYDIKK